MLGNPGHFTPPAAFHVDNICPEHPCPGQGASIHSGMLLALSHTVVVGDRNESVTSSRGPRQNEWLRDRWRGRGRGRDRKDVVRASAFLSIDHKLRMTCPVGFVSCSTRCRRKSGCNTRLKQHLQHYFNIQSLSLVLQFNTRTFQMVQQQSSQSSQISQSWGKCCARENPCGRPRRW